MREEAQARIVELRKELAAGQAELEQLERRRAYLHEVLLRMTGAVQVLEELMGQAPNGAEGAESSNGHTQSAERASSPAVG